MARIYTWIIWLTGELVISVCFAIMSLLKEYERNEVTRHF